MRNEECGLEIAVKYCITVYFHAEYDCGMNVCGLHESFDHFKQMSSEKNPKVKLTINSFNAQ